MKRILYICNQNPFGNSYGAQQRTSLLCDVLCEKGQVDLVCFTSEKQPQIISKANCTIKYFGKLPAKVSSKARIRFEKIQNLLFSFSPYSVFKRNKVASNIIDNLVKINDYDYIVVRYIKNAFMCGLYFQKRLIIDVDDLPEQFISSYANTIRNSRLKSMQYKFYAIRAKFHTNRFLQKTHHSFFPNEHQCKWPNSSYLPNIPYPNNNAVILTIGQTQIENSFIVLFIGVMLHSPNFHGVVYFIENIWGKIKEAVPSATFRIVGKSVSVEQKQKWEKHKGIQVVGFVSDITHEYEKCKVVVVPIFYGAGSNIKILEAMSMKRSCVISEFASRPFKNDLVDNINILIAMDDQDFANKVIRLLLNNDYNSSLAVNASRIIKEKYSHSVFVECVNNYIL